jgi:RNA polymerase sigma factor (sigma-70 family)
VTLLGDDPPNIPDEDPSVDPEIMAFARQFRECLELSMNALSETYREVIRLRHFEELKHSEIAERLGKAIGYVG